MDGSRSCRPLMLFSIELVGFFVFFVSFAFFVLIFDFFVSFEDVGAEL